MCCEYARRREKVFLGIPLTYWIIAIVCWILCAVCMYLMFVFTPLEIDLALSTISTLLGLTSVVSLLTGASKEDMRLLRGDLVVRLSVLEQVIRESSTRQEELLKQILEELRRR